MYDESIGKFAFEKGTKEWQEAEEVARKDAELETEHQPIAFYFQKAVQDTASLYPASLQDIRPFYSLDRHPLNRLTQFLSSPLRNNIW